MEDIINFCDENKNKKGIYSIKNLCNGYIYIGQTKNTFQKRYWMHCWLLKNNKHDNYKLQNDWNLYGEDMFLFDIVEIVDDDDSAIDNLEIKYITQARENGKCYNIQDGGQPTLLHKYRNKESYRRVGEINRERMLGTKLSLETREKMSKSRSGRWIHRRNDTLTEDQIKEAKRMLISGLKPSVIADKINVDKTSISRLLASNTYKTIYVDGWDEFQANRKKKNHIISDSDKQKIKEMYSSGCSINDICKYFGYTYSTVKKYI